MEHKKILVNATQSEELRVAIVSTTSQTLLDLLTERPSYKTKTGNIYMGYITAIEPSLNACFVSYGGDRHGFLPFKEIAYAYLNTDVDRARRAPVKDLLKENQRVMVQVEKEERGNKGAALTTFISLAGSYLVLMPNNPRAGGISRRVEGVDRDELRSALGTLTLPEEMGLIIRTAGVGKAAEELQWDLNTLLKQWEAIQKAAAHQPAPFLIHQESDVLIRAIRDYLREDVTEILVDDTKTFERIKNYLEQIRPDFISRLKLYTGHIPLFSRYQIEHQIEAAHQRDVRLPSGGSIVIGHTEALVAIDVNSGQATKGKDIEQTALEINKEAARAIACQLRIRDIGGLVVIDFIDMSSARHRREVENELRHALRMDKAKTQVGNISPLFGLLEMSRQRLRHSLGEATRLSCPRCEGWGSIRSIESVALSIIRVIEEEALKPNTVQIQVQLPVEVATFIINEKRNLISDFESRHRLEVIIIPNPKLESPHYKIKRLTQNESGGHTSGIPSYKLIEKQEAEITYQKTKDHDETPAVQSFFTKRQTTQANDKSNLGLMKRLIANLLGIPVEKKEAQSETQVTETSPSPAPAQTARGHTARSNRKNDQRSDHAAKPGTEHAFSHKSSHPKSGNRKPRPAQSQLPSTLSAPSVHTAVTHDVEKLQKVPSFANTSVAKTHKNRAAVSQPTKRVQPPPELAVKENIEALVPPDYLSLSIPDDDLEAYYQEGVVLADKKSKTNRGHRSGSARKTTPRQTHTAVTTTLPPAAVTPPVPVLDKEVIVRPSTITVEPASHAAEPKISVSLSAPPSVSKDSTKDKLWVPHKVVPAAQVKKAASTAETPMQPKVSVDLDKEKKTE